VPESQKTKNGRLASLASNPLVTVPILELWVKRLIYDGRFRVLLYAASDTECRHLVDAGKTMYALLQSTTLDF